jgi:hypothetical protein
MLPLKEHQARQAPWEPFAHIQTCVHYTSSGCCSQTEYKRLSKVPFVLGLAAATNGCVMHTCLLHVSTTRASLPCNLSYDNVKTMFIAMSIMCLAV